MENLLIIEVTSINMKLLLDFKIEIGMKLLLDSKIEIGTYLSLTYLYQLVL